MYTILSLSRGDDLIGYLWLVRGLNVLVETAIQLRREGKVMMRLSNLIC